MRGRVRVGVKAITTILSCGVRSGPGRFPRTFGSAGWRPARYVGAAALAFLAAAILDAAPDVIVSANPGCILQIAAGLREAGSRARVIHIARFLDDPNAAIAGDP